MVSEESMSPSSPDSDYWVNLFKSSGQSDLAKDWLDSKRIDRDRDDDSKRRKDLDTMEEKKKRVKDRGRLK